QHAHSFPSIRLWSVEHSMVLGAQDTATPHLQEGLHHLLQQQWQLFVRTSGGRIVGLTNDIVNLSLLFPNHRIYPTNWYFEQCFLFVQNIFSQLGIVVSYGEVSKSMCSGTYDITIDGKKVAGIALKKKRNCTIVHCYIQMFQLNHRTFDAIEHFYTRTHLPHSVSYAMHTSIDEWCDSISIAHLSRCIAHLFSEHDIIAQTGKITDAERLLFTQETEKLRLRSLRLLR
ncbi:MAG: lipoate--protein ligase family protein, partial [Bacilli bacterium]